MKKLLSLFLFVLLLFCMVSCGASSTEADLPVNDGAAVSPSAEPVKITLPENFVQVHSFSECSEMLDELLPDTDLRYEKIDVAAYEIVHCESAEGIGYYTVEFLGSERVGNENKNCRYGAVGGIDVRYQYMDRYAESCTVCGLGGSYSESRWGDWTCKD